VIRPSLCLAAGACACTWLTASAAVADPQAGMSFGLRTGYSMPSGQVGKAGPTDKVSDLGDSVKGMVPLWLDIGYRVTPNLYLGGSFQYAFGFVNKDKAGPICEQAECSTHDLAFGANVQYHFLPTASFDPWIGAGLGYEILTLSLSQSGSGKASALDQTAKGLQFLNLQLGGDIATSPQFVVGPFVNVTVGKFNSYSVLGKSGGTTVLDQSGDLQDAQIYEWITVGLRGQFNL
jgi:outer membrane protein W